MHTLRAHAATHPTLIRLTVLISMHARLTERPCCSTLHSVLSRRIRGPDLTARTLCAVPQLCTSHAATPRQGRPRESCCCSCNVLQLSRCAERESRRRTDCQYGLLPPFQVHKACQDITNSIVRSMASLSEALYSSFDVPGAGRYAGALGSLGTHVGTRYPPA